MQTTKLTEDSLKTVLHTEFRRVFDEVETFVMDVLDPDTYQSKRIKWLLGPSRAGKSHLCKEIVDKHSLEGIDEESGRRTINLLKVSVEASGSKSALADAILRGLGMEHFCSSASASVRLGRAIDALNLFGVKLLIIDEIQSMTDGKDKSIRHSADVLKHLSDNMDGTVMLVGLPNALALMSRNTQLANRSEAPIYLLPYDPCDEDDVKALAKVNLTYYNLLKAEPYRMAINFDDFDLAMRYLTGGLVGLTNKFINILAIEHSKQLAKSKAPVVQIDEKMLFVAARKMAIDTALKINPFVHAPTDKDLQMVWLTLMRKEQLTSDMFAERRLFNDC